LPPLGAGTGGIRQGIQTSLPPALQRGFYQNREFYPSEPTGVVSANPFVFLQIEPDGMVSAVGPSGRKSRNQRHALNNTMSAGNNKRMPQKQRKPLIYIAEDDRYLLDLIGLLLDSEGYQHAKFTNGEDALAAFRAAGPQPSLIISDHAMGERNMNGVQFLTACKRLKPGVKAFLISGTVDENIIKVDGNPVDWFLHKPFDMNELLRIVQILLKSGSP
jgi:CheY-like chemotaxis protein